MSETETAGVFHTRFQTRTCLTRGNSFRIRWLERPCPIIKSCCRTSTESQSLQKRIFVLLKCGSQIARFKTRQLFAKSTESLHTVVCSNDMCRNINILISSYGWVNITFNLYLLQKYKLKIFELRFKYSVVLAATNRFKYGIYDGQ
jgi:hypothetical protein